MPRVGGPVVKVHVREGDLVKRGALLVSIDPEQYSLTVRQAETGLAGAKVGSEAAKLEYDRQKALLAQKAVPRAQYDMVEAKYKGALVGVQAAEVGLAQARKAQRDASIRAPYTGVVTKKYVSEGDMATSMPPTALVTMEETETLDLRVQVPAADLNRVHVGDEVVIQFQSGPKDLKAKVGRIVPSVNPGTRTFPIIVEVDNTRGIYRAGLFAEVKLGAPQATETESEARR
jgi:RND family efflux transporter MFP subunit